MVLPARPKSERGGKKLSRVAVALLTSGVLLLVLGNVHTAHADTSSPLSVYSQTSDGSAISGMYVILQQDGQYVASGFTPLTWWLNAGQTYQVVAENYGSYSFSQWSSGDTSNPTTITGPDGAASLTAIYLPSGVSSVTVTATYGGNSLSGMYVALEQGGSVINAGFTPITFSVVTGESYQVLADSYGPYTFSQWSDGNTGNSETVSASGSLTLTASYSASGYAASPQGGGYGGLGIVIPLYTYPNWVWQSVINYHAEYPSVRMMVVINPSGGPGYYDPTFASWVSTMQSDGITVLGYVSTGYTSDPLSQVDAQINDYVGWYGLHGIFVDDMENVPGYEWYYQDVASYAASDGVSYILGNPGTSVASSYVGILTYVGIYENSGVPSISLLGGYTMGDPASGFSFIAYYAGLPSQSYFDSVAQYVSWVYVTDNDNSWTSLPSYMSQEMAELAAV